LEDAEPEEVPSVFCTACATGHLDLLVELWHRHRPMLAAFLAGELEDEPDGAFKPLVLAAMAGRESVVEWLLKTGVSASALRPG